MEENRGDAEAEASHPLSRSERKRVKQEKKAANKEKWKRRNKKMREIQDVVKMFDFLN